MGKRGSLDVAADRVSVNGKPRQLKAQSTERESPLPRALPTLPWQPFPVEAIPPPLSDFVKQGAIALGCDASYIALPLLAALGAAIGNTRRIRLRRGWTEPPVIWAAVVGDSGTMKSPANDLALEPIRQRQDRAMRDHQRAMDAHGMAEASHERDLYQWRKHKTGEPPAPPQPPTCERFIVSDITVEALADRLSYAPRGLLLAREELAGWLKGFGQYKSGKGGDAQHFLTMHGARELLVDRRTGDKATLYVRNAALSITGGIQLETLRAALGREHFENGLAARLLLAMPPRTPRRWTEMEVHPDVHKAVQDVFDRLYGLQPGTEGSDTFPVAVGIEREAKGAWVKWFNQHGAEHDGLTGDLAAASGKLEGYAARFALVASLARWAGQIPPAPEPHHIGLTDIEAGIQLSAWFGHEASRLYAILDEGDDARQDRELVDLIRRKGGVIAPRELQRCCRAYPTAELAEQALDRLAKRGFGSMDVVRPGSGPGRPGTIFRLSVTADADTIAKSQGKT